MCCACLGSKSVLRLFAIVLTIAILGSGAVGKETFESWNLEPSVGQAHLIMVARLVSVSSVRIVEGAKTDVALREYRFQPVKRLKGIFQRDTLAMTSTDLGLSAEDASLPSPLKEGEFRLLILTQQRSSAHGALESYGCVSASPGMTTFEQRVPLVSGPDDPLVGTVETLNKVVDSRSRQERAKLLLERLADVDGVAAVPLLTSLKLRADWAAADKHGYARAKPAATTGNGAVTGVLAKLARSPAVAVRAAAIDVLRDMLASRQLPADGQELDDVAISLRETLESDEANTGVRVAALDALGNLLVLKSEYDWARELLTKQLTDAATNAERSAAVTAVSRIGDPQAAQAIRDSLAALPLDEAPAREIVFITAALRSDDAGWEQTEQQLLDRLKRSIAAQQSLGAEIEPLARMRSKKSLPLLLAAADQTNLASADRRDVAQALGRLQSDEAVPVLVDWVRRDQYGVKEDALEALENINSPLAAREVRPLLKTEANLPYKLQIARLLARHGIADGYALATEHLADHDHMAAAVLVLAALDDPRTSDDLSAIVAERPDRRWYAATLTGLAATGNTNAQKQLLQILNSDRNPMAAEAAEAVGLVGDAKLLPPLARLVQSRNRQIASASLMAVQRYLSDVRNSPRGLAAVSDRDTNKGLAQTDAESARKPVEIPAEARDELATAVALLAVDAYIDADVRQQALAVSRQLRGTGYDELLAQLADQAELEGSPMLAEAQAERRRMKSGVRGE